jgi:MurNAc alpha-1-phosphate uridylyltransferase
MTGRIPERMPTTAMVLAAGLGLRLRPLTLTLPKPLIEVGGRAAIDRTLDQLAEAGVRRAVVNVHHLAAMLRQHLKERVSPEIVISDESEFLADTGGGVAKALALLGEDRFFVVNSDMIWRNRQRNCLHSLAEFWDDARMDAALLMQPLERATAYGGAGDFDWAADGRLTRRRGNSAALVFTGIQILHTRLFDGAPGGAFSLNQIYDRAAAAGRLFGLAHDGDWVDVGTPAGLAAAERLFGG